MTVGIYGIFNSETRECLYVGQSKDIDTRWRAHLKRLRNKKHPRQDFVEWFHLNGASEGLLSFEVLETCEPVENKLNSLEITWFNELTPKFYGKKPPLKGKWKQSENTKKKISQSVRKAYYSKLDSPIRTIEGFRILCGTCGVEFIYNRKRKYCSVECYNKSRKKIAPSKELVEQLWFEEKKSVSQLMEIFNCSQRTVYNILNRFDIL